MVEFSNEHKYTPHAYKIEKLTYEYFFPIKDF